MNFISKLLDSWDHRKDFKNEFHNVDYGNTKKQIKALQAQLPVLIHQVGNVAFELTHLLNHVNVEALKKFDQDRSNDRPYLKLVQEFHKTMAPFYAKAFYARKDVLDTFSLFEHQHGQLIHDRADIDKRMKALKVVLDDRIFSRLEYLSSNNANFLNYEEVLILKQEVEDLKHNLNIVKQAMFDLKKAKVKLWDQQIDRINRKEKVPDSERYF